jgi:2'-5' RNA ligase
MPHATIKGFFKTEHALVEIVAALDAMMAGRTAFTVYNNGLVPFRTSGIGLIIQNLPDGSPNQELQAFHEAAMDTLWPFVAEDCNFSHREGVRARFVAHLTLAMADIPAWGFDDVLAFTAAAQPIGPASFLADSFDLFAFRSPDWRGDWWREFTWEWLRTWRLPTKGSSENAGDGS